MAGSDSEDSDIESVASELDNNRALAEPTTGTAKVGPDVAELDAGLGLQLQR